MKLSAVPPGDLCISTEDNSLTRRTEHLIENCLVAASCRWEGYLQGKEEYLGPTCSHTYTISPDCSTQWHKGLWSSEECKLCLPSGTNLLGKRAGGCSEAHQGARQQAAILIVTPLTPLCLRFFCEFLVIFFFFEAKMNMLIFLLSLLHINPGAQPCIIHEGLH